MDPSDPADSVRAGSKRDAHQSTRLFSRLAKNASIVYRRKLRKGSILAKNGADGAESPLAGGGWQQVWCAAPFHSLPNRRWPVGSFCAFCSAWRCFRRRMVATLARSGSVLHRSNGYPRGMLGCRNRPSSLSARFARQPPSFLAVASDSVRTLSTKV